MSPKGFMTQHRGTELQLLSVLMSGQNSNQTTMTNPRKFHAPVDDRQMK